jgi:NADH-quinone oxidoreductase subunit G
VIYQGSHGDRGAHRADIILPAAAYPEEAGLFVNTEGRPQLAFRAASRPARRKENWAILRALSAELDAVLPWNTIGAAAPRAGRGGAASGADRRGAGERVAGAAPNGPLGKADFLPAHHRFLPVNPIARASTLMAELSPAAKARAGAPGGGVGGLDPAGAAALAAGAGQSVLLAACQPGPAPEPAPFTPRL